jgi:SAM-dependent methyltransferase
VSSPPHLDAYRSAITEHGPGFAATLWGSPETQVLRFAVMHDMAGGFGGDRILDLGCGDGGLARWLATRQEHPARYVGLDAIAEQIGMAQSTSPPWANFQQCDVSGNWASSERFDWVLVSGTLNTMDTQLAEAVLDSAWQCCDVGLAFNFLSDQPSVRWQDSELGPAHRFSLSAWCAWALERTPLVACRQEYLDGHDATIAMRKGHEMQSGTERVE